MLATLLIETFYMIIILLGIGSYLFNNLFQNEPTNVSVCCTLLKKLATIPFNQLCLMSDDVCEILPDVNAVKDVELKPTSIPKQ